MPSCGRSLYLHDFSFLDRHQSVDLGYGVVSRLLNQLSLHTPVVLTDVAVFFQFLEEVHAIAANVTHSDPGLLGVVVGNLGQVAPARAFWSR